MHIDRRLVAFGLFLIAVGGVMTAVRAGVIGEGAARDAWTLWPLLLVGTGLSIVLAGRPGAALGGIVVAVTLGAMLGGVAATGVFPGAGLCSGNRDRADGSPFSDQGGALGTSARVTLAQDCGDLAVGTVSGSTWNIAGRSRDGRPPRIDRENDTLRVRSPDGGPFDLGGSSSWQVVVPRDPALDLEVRLNGGEGRLALGGSHLSALAIDANAGSIDVDLRDIAAAGDTRIEVNFGSATIRLPSLSMTARLSVNAGSAALCLPLGAGLRVTLDSVAASNDFKDHGLVQVGNAWETPGYASAAVRLDLRADVNAGSLALDPTRQCAG
jgi:hypothetical protein